MDGDIYLRKCPPAEIASTPETHRGAHWDFSTRVYAQTTVRLFILPYTIYYYPDTLSVTGKIVGDDDDEMNFSFRVLPEKK